MGLSKAFEVQVELGIQAVSCPGVWLCPNGKVSVQLYMLGSCIQTSSVEPTFPLIYNEKFVFHKTFFSTRKLVGLQKVLNKEILYAELIQWQNCEMGNVLATFRTSLAELLFSGKRDGRLAGVDVDLLMEPKKNFPGILSPKIEVSTKTVIEDTICQTNSCNTYVVNSEMLCSKAERPPVIPHQRKVCHSLKYHRHKQSSMPCADISQRPVFAVRKVDENLILRKPQELEHTEYCKCGKRACGLEERYYDISHVRRKSPNMKKDMCITLCDVPHSPIRKTSRTACVRKVKQCDCGDNSQEDCPVCSKYKYYFDNKSPVIKSKKNCCCGSPSKVVPIKLDSYKSDRSTKLMNYPPRDKSPSMAAQIHNRIKDTLDDCRRSPCLQNNTVSMPPYDCDCSSQEDMCSVSSFGKFYKNLYRKSKAKCGKYIACN